MLVDRGLVEEVYLPWLLSVVNGNRDFPSTTIRDHTSGTLREQPSTKLIMSPTLSRTWSPSASFSSSEGGQPVFSAYTFEKGTFAMGGRSAAIAMESAPAGSVAVVPVIGEFLKWGTGCAYGANEIVPAIYQAGDLKNIRALVLDIDSGGGAENAVPPFIEAIKYVQSLGKPVVVHGDMVASAAYYISSFADYILADNPISSAFGSIGVLISFMDYREKFAREGIKSRQIYAPQSTLKNSEYREIMDNDNEQPLIDNILKPSADRFIETVRYNRRGKIVDDSDVYKGKLYEGEDIVKSGLADGFGTLYDALHLANSMAILGK